MAAKAKYSQLFNETFSSSRRHRPPLFSETMRAESCNEAKNDSKIYHNDESVSHVLFHVRGKQQHQCDQIGLFLKDLGDKFAYKRCPNIWQTWGYFEKVETAFPTIWATLGNFVFVSFQPPVTLNSKDTDAWKHFRRKNPYHYFALYFYLLFKPPITLSNFDI